MKQSEDVVNNVVKKVKKRDGRIVDFDKNKIIEAVWKAARSVGYNDKQIALDVGEEVIKKLNEKFDGKKVPSVEEIQDIVETVLIEKNYSKIAKDYILYRNKRQKIRELKEALGVKDELKLSINAIKVLESRYLLKDTEGRPIESSSGLFRRSAKYMALVEILYNKKFYDKERKQSTKEIKKEQEQELFEYMKALGYNIYDYEMLKRAYSNLNIEGRMKVDFSEIIFSLKNNLAELKKLEDEFYEMMTKLYFLPNSPTLMNASTRLGQLSACFVLGVGDSIPEIFDAVKNTALIHQTGGGTGFSFSKIRPKGDIVTSTKGVSSGPLSFMRVFDVTTEVIKQGGKRRGANMGIMSVHHPDILEFITSKDSENRIFSNFNISVAITDKFIKALEEKKEYELINPRNNEVVSKISAQKVWDLIIYQAWKTGDPGVIFIDRINKFNPTPHVGIIEATNPCGEQPLLNYESCNLGSINLSLMVDENKEINWKLLEKTVKSAVHFLDNVIDANKYVIPQIERLTRANRKIGLGIMGWAEMLIKLEIKYDSEEALELAEKVMKFITEKAREKSVELAEYKGVFPNFKGSIWAEKNIKVRNATVTTIAPTGTLSIIADTSSGIEPLFALAFVRKGVLGETELIEVNRLLESVLIKEELHSEEIMKKIIETGTLENIKNIPKKIKDLFVTAHEIEPEWHVRMQAAFQKYTDNAVSKTINLKREATIIDVEKSYKLAYELGCKGITIYRDQSKNVQVIYKGASQNLPKDKTERIEPSLLKEEMSSVFEESEESCPVCGAKLYFAEGCHTCLSCGYSKCG
ncbi:MAG: adenosylcobalamin-dependent ribonucleoside-diphosphate reductase [Candidatus Woesearchaeota archaeon]